MVSGLRPIIVSLLLVSLFTLSMFIFGTTYITNNNPSFVDETNSSIYLSNINDSLVEFSNHTQNQLESVSKASLSPIYLFVMAQAFFEVPLSFIKIIMSTFNNIIGFIALNIFGTESGTSFWIIIITLGAIIALTVILAFIKAVRTGESER